MGEEVELEMRESCGLFGCINTSSPFSSSLNVPDTVRCGLEQLQHRYSTAGMKEGISCIQPFVVHTVAGLIAVAHNGELVDADERRLHMLQSGVGLSTDTDSELISQLIAKKLADMAKTCGYIEDIISTVIKKLVEELSLSFSLLIMTKDKIFAVRDRWGNRPLCVGKIMNRESEPMAYVTSSETCAFACVGAKFVGEVLPGQVVELGLDGITFHPPSRDDLHPTALCIFEYVYFARPDSHMEGQGVKTVRERCGRELGIESPVIADIVTTVPDSATPAAEGYALETNIPFKTILCKNAYVGRSFIEPNTAMRQSAVKRKFGVFKDCVKGKRIVLVDDSIVRGNTMGPIVKLLRENGATQVHLRIASPPIRNPCYYGINIPKREELIACQKTGEELAAYFSADSVVYLSIDGLKRAVRGADPSDRHCTGCLDADYPVSPAKQHTQPCR